MVIVNSICLMLAALGFDYLWQAYLKGRAYELVIVAFTAVMCVYVVQSQVIVTADFMEFAPDASKIVHEFKSSVLRCVPLDTLAGD